MSDALADILAEAENPAYVRVATAKVLLRQDLVVRLEELDAELQAAVARDANSNEPDQAPGVAARIADLEAEMEKATREFVFANVGKKTWADLLKDHPPTSEQIADEAADAKLNGRRARQLEMNPDTFPIAAMAASSKTPKMGEDDIRRLEASMTDTQFTLLWNACLKANLGGADIPKSVAAGQILRMNGRYATSVSAAGEHSAAANS